MLDIPGGQHWHPHFGLQQLELLEQQLEEEQQQSQLQSLIDEKTEDSFTISTTHRAAVHANGSVTGAGVPVSSSTMQVRVPAASSVTGHKVPSLSNPSASGTISTQRHASKS